MSEELKYRINQLEVSPPKAVWDNISSELDEWKEWKPISARLLNAAITPPAGNWEQIEKRLEVPVVEIKNPTRKIGFAYRVAASVIIVILLISGGWKWFQTSKVDVDGKDLQNASINKNSLLPSFSIDIQKSTKQEKINSFAKNNISLRNTSSENNDPLYTRAVSYTSIEGSRWLTKETPIVIAPKPIESDELETKQTSMIGSGQDNKYLFIKSPDGQTIRVSIKFAELYSYLVNDFDNDVSLDITNEEGKNWGKLIKEWREKIIRSGYTPTSGNFLDIVEFRDFLRKNQ